jgi:hypothetical protein
MRMAVDVGGKVKKRKRRYKRGLEREGEEGVLLGGLRVWIWVGKGARLRE